MAVSNIAIAGREASIASEQTERKEALFEEQRRTLEEARRRTRITQEESSLAEAEEEQGLGTGELDAGGAERVSVFSYAGPFVVACFKDLLDFTVILALPGLGTIIGVCLDILIFLLLIFPKQRYRLMMNARLIIIDAFILMGLVPLEGLAFPLNLLPFTVAAVGMIYMFDKKFVAARNSKRFDRKEMKTNLSGVIRRSWSDRKNADKGGVSRKTRTAWDTPEKETA